MSRLVKLEKLVERGLGRLRHPKAELELVEAIPEVLDDVEDHLEPSGGRGRVFPFQKVLVAFRVPNDDRLAARAQLEDLPERIRQRLRSRGCEPAADLEIHFRFVTVAGEEWNGRTFRVWYRRKRVGGEAPAPPPPPPAPESLVPLRLTVVRGRTGDKERELALTRINLGRLEKVSSASGRARKNHVWFAASEDTVSRAHAHIERVGNEYLLFDEGSASGTRVLRQGEEIELMPKASRGVRLKDGDRIELGKGCLIEVRLSQP